MLHTNLWNKSVYDFQNAYLAQRWWAILFLRKEGIEIEIFFPFYREVMCEKVILQSRNTSLENISLGTIHQVASCGGQSQDTGKGRSNDNDKSQFKSHHNKFGGAEINLCLR